ncbi:MULTISPECIES: hypothetical protein [Arthrobacter]|uniref:Yip1 domain-containing protein n=1 Tax=Arthrobacter terricola TaxID=2547396 RepID=A0A4R5KV63_9MICC|nr:MULTISPECIES: hypothetical protein [Arthrobacter]MBT8159927.1 hypothetical protein [Arthrobacter sp. GN70]TDF98995.1 hypothetical protein E1809_05275 [Arthrobacter terricola]
MIPAAPSVPDPSPPHGLREISPAWITFLLLAYTASAQFAVGTEIDRLVTDNAEHNRFSSQEVLLTFVRLSVIAWGILASFLQALVLRLIYMGIVKGPAPTLRFSWFWVLLGQIPFIATVIVMGLFLQPEATGLLGQAWIRILFGTIAAAIYIAAAKKLFVAPMGRLAVLFVVVVVVNSILLVSGSSA